MLGCGPGRPVAQHVAELGLRVTGVDSSCLPQRRAAPGRMLEIGVPLCEASHATPFQPMITYRPERDTGSWVAHEAAHKTTQFLSWSLAVGRRAPVPGSLRELPDYCE